MDKLTKAIQESQRFKDKYFPSHSLSPQSEKVFIQAEKKLTRINSALAVLYVIAAMIAAVGIIWIWRII